MNPLVSVIIPVFNGASFLGEALDSVFAQDYRPIEVIVADDGSTDDSAAIAESFPEVRCLRLEHGGVAWARNIAIRDATGTWLAFLDADDRWFPQKLSVQIAMAERDPGSGFILGERTARFESEIPDWFRGPRDGSAVTGFETSSWLVRRDLLEMVGPFDEGRSLGEDTDWIARALDAGVRYIVPEGALLERRIHPNNATSTVTNQRSRMLGILRDSVRRKQSSSNANGS